MRKLVLLHDVQPEDSIADLVDRAMRAIHGDEPWPEDNGEDLDADDAESSPGGDPDEDSE